MANPLVIGLLQSKLKTVLKNQDLILGELNPASGLFSIIKAKGLTVCIDVESGHTVGLFPFRVAQSYDYWLSIVIEFSNARKKIGHVSVSFFDENKYKLFRADWANNVSATKHGQPHWHVINHKSLEQFPDWDSESVSDFTDKKEEESTDLIQKLHFSMTSSWYKEFIHEKSLNASEDKEIINWIASVLEYSIQQLTYVHDKRVI